MDPATISILVTVLSPILTGLIKWIFPDVTKDTMKAIPVVAGGVLNCVGVLTGADASLDFNSIAMAGGAGAAYGSLGSKLYDVKKKVVRSKKTTGLASIIFVFTMLTGCAGMSIKVFEDKAQSLGLGACAVIKVLPSGPRNIAKLTFSYLGTHLEGLDGNQITIDLNKTIETVKTNNPELSNNIKHWGSFEAGIKAVSLSVQGVIDNQNTIDALNFLKRFVGTVNGCVGTVVAKDGIKMADPCLAGYCA